MTTNILKTMDGPLRGVHCTECELHLSKTVKKKKKNTRVPTPSWFLLCCKVHRGNDPFALPAVVFGGPGGKQVFLYLLMNKYVAL